jgi:hypothetical protein
MTADGASRGDRAKARAGWDCAERGRSPVREAALAHSVKRDAGRRQPRKREVEIGLGRHVLGSDASERPMVREMMRQRRWCSAPVAGMSKTRSRARQWCWRGTAPRP